jgi:hypothetical protein
VVEVEVEVAGQLVLPLLQEDPEDPVVVVLAGDLLHQEEEVMELQIQVAVAAVIIILFPLL